jgi:hypothetical protein
VQTRQAAENYRFDITPLDGALSKPDRIKRLASLFEQGRIYLPDSLIKTDYEGRAVDLMQAFIEQALPGGAARRPARRTLAHFGRGAGRGMAQGHVGDRGRSLCASAHLAAPRHVDDGLSGTRFRAQQTKGDHAMASMGDLYDLDRLPLLMNVTGNDLPPGGSMAALMPSGASPPSQPPIGGQAPTASLEPTTLLERLFGPASSGQPRNALDPLGLTGYLGLADAPSPQPSWYMGKNDTRAQFYDLNYGPAARALAPYSVDPTLPLGQAVQESGWFTNSTARERNNPFGYMNNRGELATFPSLDAAWQRWADDFGPRVQGVGSDAAAYVQKLQTGGPMPDGRYKGPYNSDDQDYVPRLLGGTLSDGTTTAGTIPSVRALLPHWRGNLDALP